MWIGFKDKIDDLWGNRVHQFEAWSIRLIIIQVKSDPINNEVGHSIQFSQTMLQSNMLYGF